MFDSAGQAGRYVEFEPESWQGDGWKVESITRPAMVPFCVLMSHFKHTFVKLPVMLF